MKNVLLVFGGKSYEHDISVVTASQIYNRTKTKDISFVPLYVSREGEYFVYLKQKFNLSDFSINGFNPKSKNFKPVCFVSGEKGILFVKSFFGLKEYLHSELAIVVCHGGAGENGKLISDLESVGIFSQAGKFDALAVSMNKFLFKQVMKGLKIPVVSGFCVTKNKFEKDMQSVIKDAKKLRFPLIVKQNNGGSSIGVFESKNEDELIENLKSAFLLDSEVVIEKLVEKTREFNVAVIGTRDNFKVSEVDEPLKIHSILNFSDKYLSGEKQVSAVKNFEFERKDKTTKKKDRKKQGECSNVSGLKFSQAKGGIFSGTARKFPADIDENFEQKLKQYSAKIFENLGLCGVVRIDFLYDTINEKLYVCEVNSIPGSLAYYFFCQGASVDSFIKILVSVAEENAKNSQNFNSSYIANILEN